MNLLTAPTVWSWWGPDALLAQHLAFTAAVPRHSDLEAILRRLGLPEPAVASRLAPHERGFTEAARAPGCLLWMPLERFTRGATAWHSEEQLTVARFGQRQSSGDTRHSVRDERPQPRRSAAGDVSLRRWRTSSR